jgi:hypothetical protein
MIGLASSPLGAKNRILPKMPAEMPDLKAFTSSFQAFVLPHLGHLDGIPAIIATYLK